MRKEPERYRSVKDLDWNLYVLIGYACSDESCQFFKNDYVPYHTALREFGQPRHLDLHRPGDNPHLVKIFIKRFRSPPAQENRYFNLNSWESINPPSE